MSGIYNQCNCLDCLRRSPVFNKLTNEELEYFNENRYETSYNAGEIIFKQGTAMTHLMSFTEGLAKVYIEGLNKRNLILRLVLPGEFIGGPGMLTDHKHHFTVRAIEDSKACFIDIHAFKEVMKYNPDFALECHKSANEHTLNSFSKFISLTQKQMPGRIADAILYLYKGVYKTNPFSTALSRQDLADMTALSKESAIRILKQFKDDAIINLNNSSIEILDEEALVKISQIG